MSTNPLANDNIPSWETKVAVFLGNFQILRVFLKVALISATFHKIGNFGKTCNFLPFEVL